MPSIHVLRTELSRSVSGIRESIDSKGLAKTAGRVAAVAGAQLAYPLTKNRRQEDRFEFLGEHLPYTFSRYNNSFLNERAVEISIANWFLARSTGRVLEVGNVLTHYGVTGQTVLDKYEVIPGVLNEDIADFTPESRFDTVIAISTLEHVGWDESPREPEKVFKAIENVKNCAKADGQVLVTMPIGHNKALDAGLREGRITFAKQSWLARRNHRNQWAEVERDEALGKAYGRPYTGANGLYVGMISAD